MSELNIPIIPTNFTVWFTYVLGRSPALRKTIVEARTPVADF